MTYAYMVRCDAPGCERAASTRDQFYGPPEGWLTLIQQETEPGKHFCSRACLAHWALTTATTPATATTAAPEGAPPGPDRLAHCPCVICQDGVDFASGTLAAPRALRLVPPDPQDEPASASDQDLTAQRFDLWRLTSLAGYATPSETATESAQTVYLLVSGRQDEAATSLPGLAQCVNPEHLVLCGNPDMATRLLRRWVGNGNAAKLVERRGVDEWVDFPVGPLGPVADDTPGVSGEP